MSINEVHNTFRVAPGFCLKCGSILPLLKEKGGVECYTCKEIFGIEVFGNMTVKYTLNFNLSEKEEVIRKKVKSEKFDDEDDGPVVERRCPICNNDKMSYATLQLRSADEGQTVFYTCTKCKFKETENS